MHKDSISKIPVIGKAIYNFGTWLREKQDQLTLEKLKSVKTVHSEVVHSGLIRILEYERQELPQQIRLLEEERKRLLKNNMKLVDSSLPNEGLYDGDKTVREVCEVSRDPKAAYFIYQITSAVQPFKALELGTNVGISSAYIAAAMLNSDIKGTLYTLDASPYRQRIAKEVHQNIGLGNVEYIEGLFSETLGQVLNDMGCVDLAFIDGHHQYQPTLNYWNRIYPFTKPGSIILFDDIRYSIGMKKAWAEMLEDRRFDLVVDLKNIGLCVCGKNENNRNRNVIPTIHRVLR
jgi:predicted O-methyltransferase YrrM